MNSTLHSAPAQTPDAKRLDALADVLRRAERADLVARLESARRRRAQRVSRVLVVGEFKKGKSTLVNALLNGTVSPVDDDLATARPIEVYHDERHTASIVLRPDDPLAKPQVRQITLDDIAAYALEATPDGEQIEPNAIAVRIGVPRQLLKSGLVIVDTPGVGGMGTAHHAATVGALPAADAVFFVTDVSQELTVSEMEFLRTVQSLCPTVVCVETKTDFYPSWRKIVELDRAHLRRAGIEVDVLPVSSTLRMVATARKDNAINNESGFGDLVTVLRSQVSDSIQREADRQLADDIAAIVGDLRHQLDVEMRAIDDPHRSEELMAGLAAAKERMDLLRSQSSRWQQALTDGNSDLVADVEHDLRHRIRETQRLAEEAIDKFDPSKSVWDNFVLWLCAAVSADVVHNFQLLQHRSHALAANVAEQFSAAQGPEVSNLPLVEAIRADFQANTSNLKRVDRPSTASQAIAALRGTSGGMIMFGAFANFVLDTPLNDSTKGAAVMLASGVMLGSKTVIDDRKRQLAMRRSQAKAMVRKYTDETMFMVAKESRDALRRMQRDLRDHFLRLSDELTAATSAAHQSARQAVQSSDEGRKQRGAQVQNLLKQLTLATADV